MKLTDLITPEDLLAAADKDYDQSDDLRGERLKVYVPVAFRILGDSQTVSAREHFATFMLAVSLIDEAIEAATEKVSQ